MYAHKNATEYWLSVISKLEETESGFFHQTGVFEVLQFNGVIKKSQTDPRCHGNDKEEF